MNILYNNDIPNGPNNPTSDQPLMKINTNAVDTWAKVDHLSFNTNGGGWHKQVTLPSTFYTIPPDPNVVPPITLAQMVLFTTLVGTPQSSVLAYIKDGSTTAFPFMAAENPDFTASNYSTSMLGGFQLKFGDTPFNASTGSVTFAKPFLNNAFAAFLTFQSQTTGPGSVWIRSAPNNLTKTGFGWRTDDASPTGTLYWFAIGN